MLTVGQGNRCWAKVTDAGPMLNCVNHCMGKLAVRVSSELVTEVCCLESSCYVVANDGSHPPALAGLMVRLSGG